MPWKGGDMAINSLASYLLLLKGGDQCLIRLATWLAQVSTNLLQTGGLNMKAKLFSFSTLLLVLFLDINAYIKTQNIKSIIL